MTPLEATRLVVAFLGAVMAAVSEGTVILDYRRLRADGGNGPTAIIYAEKMFTGGTILTIQVAYNAVGWLAAITPEPITRAVTVYNVVAVWVSLIVSLGLAAITGWQFLTRYSLLNYFRKQARMVAMGDDTRHRARDAGRDVARDAKRDTARDEKHDNGRDADRDVDRDVDRDAVRDITRDVGRDVDRDRTRDPIRDTARDEKHDDVGLP